MKHGLIGDANNNLDRHVADWTTRVRSFARPLLLLMSDCTERADLFFIFFLLSTFRGLHYCNGAPFTFGMVLILNI